MARAVLRDGLVRSKALAIGVVAGNLLRACGIEGLDVHYDMRAMAVVVEQHQVWAVPQSTALGLHELRESALATWPVALSHHVRRAERAIAHSDERSLGGVMAGGRQPDAPLAVDEVSVAREYGMLRRAGAGGDGRISVTLDRRKHEEIDG
jgi:hypothetical protein